MHQALGARIRPATPADAEAVAHLHVDVWEDAYAGLVPAEVLAERRARVEDHVERWRRQLDEAPEQTVVAENETGLVGFARFGPPRDEDVDVPRELWALYVRAAWWGTGIGQALLAAAVGGGPACLWVLQGNERAVSFYRKHGFAADGATRDRGLGPEIRMVR